MLSVDAGGVGSDIFLSIISLFFLPRGWSGGAKVLGKLSVPVQLVQTMSYINI